MPLPPPFGSRIGWGLKPGNRTERGTGSESQGRILGGGERGGEKSQPGEEGQGEHGRSFWGKE